MSETNEKCEIMHEHHGWDGRRLYNNDGCDICRAGAYMKYWLSIHRRIRAGSTKCVSADCDDQWWLEEEDGKWKMYVECDFGHELQIIEGIKFCPVCGRKLEDEDETTEEE